MIWLLSRNTANQIRTSIVSKKQSLPPSMNCAKNSDVVAAKSVVVCWAMGLTQHRNSVATIREIVNFLFSRQHRAAWRGTVAHSRSQQRPGRPHDGDLGEDARFVP